MKSSGTYLLVYDVSSDKTRERLAKLISGFGSRVQQSAFECRLTRGLKKRLWSSIDALCLAESDQVALYAIASSPAQRKGVRADEPMSENHHAVVL